MTADHPEVACTLELGPSLARSEALPGAVERPLGELMATLGVPGRATVSVEAARGQAAEGILGLTVGGRRCLYPEALLGRIHEYVHGQAVPPNDDSLAAFLGMACVEIVKLQPGVLLGPPQTQAYSEDLAANADRTGRRREPWPPDPDWLLPVLRDLLDLRISIADRDRVAEELSASGQDRQGVTERLVVAFRPQVLELELPMAYLRELTEAVGTAERGTFASVRSRVFMDLGIVPPPFRLAPVEHLKPRTFACKVNHLSATPMPGLAPGERRDVDGRGTIGPLGYMGTALEQAVRAHAPCLIDRQTVQTQLELLGQAFPALVDVASALVPIDQATGALRALAMEGRSTRNMRQILERLLDEHDPPVGASELDASLA